MPRRPKPDAIRNRAKLTVHLTTEEHQRIKGLAAIEKVSFSRKLRELVAFGLELAEERHLERIQVVCSKVKDGLTVAQITEFCSEQWQLDPQQSKDLIKAARDQLEQECAVEHKAFVSEALDRLAQLTAQAQASKGSPAPTLRAR